MKPITKRKILLVDDENQWRDMVSAALSEAGFDVLSTADGSEAMRQADDHSLGMMLVDEDLAGESGILLTQFLRYNHPDVPTMLYTSNRQAAHQTLALMRQGVDRCLHKGSMDDLIVNVAYYAR
jgi:two-component system, OmpR family, response regulator